GAHAGAARNLVQIVGDAGEADEMLAGRADLRHLDAGVAQLFQQRLLDVARDAAPEVGGVADLDLGLVDPEVDRRLRGAVHHDRVPAGTLQLRTPEAAGLGLAEAAVERGLATDGVAAGARHRRTGEHARREDEDILRA